jgi:hypothetical protein
MVNLQSFSISLWNANGLRITTIQDSLSHVLDTNIFFITETWLTPPMLIPTNWPQFHLYGSKVDNANNRGSGGVTALVNPDCPYSVTQLPSPNAYTLSLKIGSLRIHCMYLPPSLRLDHVFDILNSIPLLSDTIICGDLNARLGELVGDLNTNYRGQHLLTWLKDRQLTVLNDSLAHGAATFTAFRRGEHIYSIIDLFISNIDPSSMSASKLNVERDLSLGSDHRLMTLSFDLDPSQDDTTNPEDHPCVLAPRRLWNLSRLGEFETSALYRSHFESLVSPLHNNLSDLVNSPPSFAPPDLNQLNLRLNDCIYEALDATVGNKSPRPGYWKKYWNPELQKLAQFRDACYSKWRRSTGIDKIHWWSQHQVANGRFHSAVKSAKRASWKQFCATLETNFGKATFTIKNIKRRHASSSTYSHPDGPAVAVNVMSDHLESVFEGSSLPTDRPAAPPPITSLPHPLPRSSLLECSSIKYYLRQLPLRKAPGTDHLKAEMLKPLSSALIPVLSLLFKLCWQWSDTPHLWREASVFPIHKKGSMSDPANFRPISLTSVMRKLFEHVISSSVISHSPPLDVAQGGFRPQRSPLDQALCLHDLMHDYFLTHHHYPSVAFLDIKSAYDTVDRRVIWHALAESTLPKAVLALLINLFDEVAVSVLVSNHASVPFGPVTGVLQGSVLSPHLYSIYINSLPAMLRQAASPHTTTVTVPGDIIPTSINSLLFADDVAIFGTKDEVQSMLDLAAQHSHNLGYRWNPSKCAIVNAPSTTSSTSQNFGFTLYGQDIPTVDEFMYLGMPIGNKGLSGASILPLRSPGAIKTMALLTSIGVHRNGFSLLLCARLYTCFIRPKLEYGLAISRLRAPDINKLEKVQDRLVGMFLGSNHTMVAKHITCLPPMVHRHNILVTRYALRSGYQPDDALVVLLRNSLRYPRINMLLKSNPLYLSLPDPPHISTYLLRNHFREYWQEYFDQRMVSYSASGKHVLLRACRPCTFKPDPILYLPMSTTSRSRLVRWRLGRFTAMQRQECPCMSGAMISRDHFSVCRAIAPSLLSELPASPPGVNRIDFAITSLPIKPNKGPPPYWPALLSLLWYIDTLCHPLSNIPEDPDPGSSWFSLQG